MLTSVVADVVVPPMTTVAVMVKVAFAVTAEGVPEIVPVVGSNTNPVGRVPLIEYVANVPASLSTEVVIGVIAIPTASIVDVTDVVSRGLVINVDVVMVGPAPAAFTAATVAVYWVPGARPVRFTEVLGADVVLEAPLTTGVTVTV